MKRKAALELDAIAQRYGKLPADVVDEMGLLPAFTRFELNVMVARMGGAEEASIAQEQLRKLQGR